MSSNLRETAVCRERYRKGGMRTTLKTIRIWTWSTLTFTTRTKILTGTRPRKKVVMCMLLLTPPQSNHLVSMIKLQWAHASIISVVNLIQYWKRSVRASRRVIKSQRRGSYACISTTKMTAHSLVLVGVLLMILSTEKCCGRTGTYLCNAGPLIM